MTMMIMMKKVKKRMRKEEEGDEENDPDYDPSEGSKPLRVSYSSEAGCMWP